MIQLNNKHVLLGITGSISAYKAATLASRLTQMGAKVDVVMTENATKLIAPATFEALTHRRVYTNTFSNEFTGEVDHIAVGQRADIAIIAPASANMIAKIAHGIADDMLSTTMLAVTAPVWIAPAMNTHMFENIATQENIEILRRRGFHIVEPDSGVLACGTSGKGRLPDPELLAEFFYLELGVSEVLKGKKVLISAGATREFLDPVRFLSNPSTGKMGISCARAALLMGADVTLVCGHTEARVPTSDRLRVVPVTSAKDMADEILGNSDNFDVIIMSAAVSDFTPKQFSQNKVHKTDAESTVEFTKTTDILKALGEKKKEHQFLCGFCMETENLIERAKDKLIRKNADLIAANNLTQPNCGFAHDTNGLTLVTPKDTVSLPVMSKDDAAYELLKYISEHLDNN